MIYYDDERDKYHDAWDTAIDYYYEEAYGSETYIPEVLYETKPVEVEDWWINSLTQGMLDFVDNNCPELSSDGDWFSDSLEDKDKEEFKEFLKKWLTSKVNIVTPDYNKPTPFRSEFLSNYPELELNNGCVIRKINDNSIES